MRLFPYQYTNKLFFNLQTRFTVVNVVYLFHRYKKNLNIPSSAKRGD